MVSREGRRDMTHWVRFEQHGAIGWGALSPGGEIEVHRGDLFGAHEPNGARVMAQDVRLLAPLTPRSIIGLWNNFHALAAKLGQATPTHPLYFFKAVGAVVGPGDAITAPESLGRVAYEGELAIVIGKTISAVSHDAAQAAIFGYTCINDVTALEILNADASFPQWARAKSCDTFAPLGPAIVTEIDLATAHVRTLVGGRERQNYALSDMIFDPARIVSLISRDMTLHPGDVIACGTSIGVLPMRAGSDVEVVIDGIGALKNRFEIRKQEEGVA